MHLVAGVFLSLLNAAEQSRQRINLQGRATSQSGALDLFLLPEGKYEGGKCMDGSQAGYYYGPPSSGSSTLWVIFLKGGGGCETKADCQKWANKTGLHFGGGIRGGSAGWDSQMFGEQYGSGQLSSDAEINPDFHDAHHVYVPYCTGDNHVGTISNPTEAENFGYFFDGHLNVKAIAEDLRAQIPAAASMQRVLFQGTSAGGLGVFTNCDFLQDQLGASVSVWCNPQKGWFLPGNIQDGADPKSPPTSFEFWSVGSPDPERLKKNRPYMVYRHQGCVDALGAEAELCDTVHVLYQYIKAPIYAVQDMVDTSVLVNVQGDVAEGYLVTPKGREYAAYIGNCTKSSMTQITNHPQGKVGDGYFLPACIAHGSDPDLDGFKKADGLGDWFFGRDVVPRVLIGECASVPPYLPCTPGCPHLPPVAAPTPPTPPNDGGDCQATLQLLCGDATGKGPCLECAKGNIKPLAKAGCTQSLVVSLCGN